MVCFFAVSPCEAFDIRFEMGPEQLGINGVTIELLFSSTFKIGLEFHSSVNNPICHVCLLQ
jgi:hypothetical protein